MDLVSRRLLRTCVLFPILYGNICRNMMSLEHVVPKCYISKEAGKDLHNIYGTSIYYNLKRKNYNYQNLQNSDKTIICNSKKIISPRISDRGVIARSILYMSDKYTIDSRFYINMTEIIDWNTRYKPTIEEYIHNEYVYRKQGNINKFIC